MSTIPSSWMERDECPRLFLGRVDTTERSSHPPRVGNRGCNGRYSTRYLARLGVAGRSGGKAAGAEVRAVELPAGIEGPDSPSPDSKPGLTLITGQVSKRSNSPRLSRFRFFARFAAGVSATASNVGCIPTSVFIGVGTGLLGNSLLLLFGKGAGLASFACGIWLELEVVKDSVAGADDEVVRPDDVEMPLGAGLETVVCAGEGACPGCDVPFADDGGRPSAPAAAA